MATIQETLAPHFPVEDSPEERRRKQSAVATGENITKLVSGQRRLQTTVGKTFSWEALGEDQMAQIALDAVRDMKGTREEKRAFGHELIGSLRQNKARALKKAGGAVETAVKGGAAEGPFTIRPTPAQEAQIKQGRQWQLTEEQARLQMIKGGRVPEEMVPRFLLRQETSPEVDQELQRLTSQWQFMPPQAMATSVGDTGGTGGGTILETAGKILAPVGEVLATGGRFAQGAEAERLRQDIEAGKTPEIFGEVPQIDMSAEPMERLKQLGTSVLKAGTAPWRIPMEVTARAVSDPGAAFDVLASGAKAAFSGDPTQRPQLAEQLARIDPKQEGLSPITRAAAESPQMGQLGMEIFADPVNVLGGKVVTGPLSLIKKGAEVPGLSKVLGPVVRGAEAAVTKGPIGSIRKALEFGFEEQQGLKGLGEAGETLASESRLAHDIGRATEAHALEAGALAARPKAPASVAISKAVAEAGFETPTEAARVLRGALPVPEGADLARLSPEIKKALVGGKKAKTAGDIGAKAELEELAGALKRAGTIPAKVGGTAKDVGVITTIKSGPKAKAAAQELAEAMTRSTDDSVEFAVIGGRAAAKIARASGGAFEVGNIVVPKVIKSRLFEVAGLSTKAPTALPNWWRTYVRPLQNIWRIKSTILRSPAFLATNTVGALGLDFLTHGVRIADPALQAAAARTSLKAAFQGVPDALDTAFRLKLGDEVPLRELFDIMHRTGYLGMGRARFALDMAATGEKGLGKALAGFEQIYRGIARASKLQSLATLGDNFQRSVAFIGALKSTKPQHIAEAADFASKFAGNYQRLTPLERGVMKDLFGFYSWNRFILPHVTRQVFENPQRLAAFQKLTNILNVYYGQNRPVFDSAIPDWLQTQSHFTAPPSAQPEAGAFSDEFAMSVAETPLNAFSALAGENAGEMALSPAAGLALYLMVTGDRLPGVTAPEFFPVATAQDFNDFDSFRRYLFDPRSESAVGRAARTLSPVPYSGPLWDIGQLYLNEGNLDHWMLTGLQYRIGRDTLGALGKGSFAGVRKDFPVRGSREALRKQRRAQRELFFDLR